MSKFPITVKTFQGLEDVTAAEMRSLGMSEVRTGTRVVYGMGNQELLYKANIWLRTALFILRPIHTGTMNSPQELYDVGRQVDWSKWMSVKQSFAIRHTVRSKVFDNSTFAALKLKDAIVDHFRDNTGQRPSINKDRPAISIDLHVDRDRVTISLDSSGEPLFKRGYRELTGVAPINEALAAGLILVSGWDKKTPFLDPMCGSGTLPIEAALIGYNLPPQLHRWQYAFQRWPDYDAALYKSLREAIPEIPQLASLRIIGSDMDIGMVRKARQNAEKAGVAHLIRFSSTRWQDHPPLREPHHIVTNPPYDERIQENDIVELYRSIADKLKKDAHGSTAWIFSASKKGLKRIGLKHNRKLSLHNGPLESEFREYQLF